MSNFRRMLMTNLNDKSPFEFVAMFPKTYIAKSAGKISVGKDLCLLVYKMNGIKSFTPPNLYQPTDTRSGYDNEYKFEVGEALERIMTYAGRTAIPVPSTYASAYLYLTITEDAWSKLGKNFISQYEIL